MVSAQLWYWWLVQVLKIKHNTLPSNIDSLLIHPIRFNIVSWCFYWLRRFHRVRQITWSAMGWCNVPAAGIVLDDSQPHAWLWVQGHSLRAVGGGAIRGDQCWLRDADSGGRTHCPLTLLHPCLLFLRVVQESGMTIITTNNLDVGRWPSKSGGERQILHFWAQ